MSPNELQQIKQQRPFVPIRMRLVDGSTFEVRRPHLMMVGIRATAIGIATRSDPGLWDKLIQVDNLSIIHVEPLA